MNKKTQTILTAAAVGLVASIGIGTLAATSGSAALQDGLFQVRTVDSDGFVGIAGMKGKGGNGTTPGTGNPGVETPVPGTPGAETPTPTAPGTPTPGGGGEQPGTGTPEVAVPALKATTISCTTMTGGNAMSTYARLSWPAMPNAEKYRLTVGDASGKRMVISDTTATSFDFTKPVMDAALPSTMPGQKLQLVVDYTAKDRVSPISNESIVITPASTFDGIRCGS
ncbi:hypothetical protein [Microbacterium sp. SORGH_AS_0421]|uniref:hypothetical protein n=1 Tax=Microbacterium sp. SORGH_AS_0421 TaxID=3041768 RepID=UPI002794CF81|nr:hypothetical protein [Microbacterium sp. SORGH_AS_0421]MDQ1175399.1 hypothetical protein [Microbacterium sp. SORGH_AS_0421]